MLGYHPRYEIIDQCSHDCRNVEKRWILHYRDTGHKLRNVGHSQGSHFAPPETRQRMSEAHKGRRVTWGDKISSSQRGMARNWSARGLKRVEATQFKKGDNGWDRLPKSTKKRIAQASRNIWKDPEKRKRMQRGSKEIAKIWAARTEAQKADIARKIAESNRASMTPARRKAISKVAKATFARPGHVRKMVRASKKWWATLTPEQRKEFIDRRTKAIAEARQRKKAAIGK